MLAAYHARWADGDGDEIAAEVGHVDEVFATMAAARPGEKDLFIAGDFNLTPPDIAVATNTADRTTGSGSTLNLQGGRTANLYDHLLVHDTTATAELTGNAQVLDARGEAPTNVSFYQTISDHLPIVAEVSIAGPDDD